MTDKEKETPTSEEDKDKNLEKGTEETAEDPKDDPNSVTLGDDDKDKDDEKKPSPYDKQKTRAEKAEKERDEERAERERLEGLLAEKADPKGEVSDEDLDEFAKEHDVDPKFVKGLADKLLGEVTKSTEKIVNDKLSEEDKERQKERILSDFKRDFDKVEADWEGGTLSENSVRLHFLTEKAKNPDHTVEDSVEEIYGSFRTGKATVENDPQGADPVGESIDFDTLSKDPEKLSKVLEDPKARGKYYAWRDKRGI